jgi:ParB family chromosome partitioning protein
MAKRQGLGRGLDALMAEMGQPKPAAATAVAVLPVGLIEPSPIQPRRHFDELALRELADSIRIKGVLQPILVRPVAGGRYEIVAGERRWRACQMAGVHEIPVVVKEMAAADGFEAALIENIQRQDLNPLEEAQGYQRLVREFGHTQETVSALTGKARSHVGNLLRLLELPENGQALVRMGILSLGHAKAVLAARDPDALAREIAERGLTVRQAEEAAKRSHDVPRPPRVRAPAERDADLEALEAQLMESVGVPVRIEARGGKGRIELRFSDLDQLDGIVARLQG